jgi:muconate cycloisomerase
MTEVDQIAIEALRVYRVSIPLINPYYLSKIYPTTTHSEVVVVELLANGVSGWGEADPGGVMFTGDTCDDVMDHFSDSGVKSLPGTMLGDLISGASLAGLRGATKSAINVAAYDLKGRLTDIPVWKMLGEKHHQSLPSLWPTSSGTSAQDMDVITPKYDLGYRTFMLKMGSNPVDEDIARVHDVYEKLPENARLMVDANQGWSFEEASTFMRHTIDLPLALVEQPIAADDYGRIHELRALSPNPISVDESLKRFADAEQIIKVKGADIFSVKISKNGGLAEGLAITKLAAKHGVKIMMNSMIELGITQAAALHLGCVTPNVVDFGHAFMSVQRTSDDITDFADWKTSGTVALPDKPGLGVEINRDKIDNYCLARLES